MLRCATWATCEPRLPAGTVERLGSHAARVHLAPRTLAQRYVEEGLRMDEHPLVRFVDGPAGRRARLVGTGSDVWEVIAAVKDNHGDIAETAGVCSSRSGSSRRRSTYYGALSTRSTTGSSATSTRPRTLTTRGWPDKPRCSVEAPARRDALGGHRRAAARARPRRRGHQSAPTARGALGQRSAGPRARRSIAPSCRTTSSTFACSTMKRSPPAAQATSAWSSWPATTAGQGRHRTHRGGTRGEARAVPWRERPRQRRNRCRARRTFPATRRGCARSTRRRRSRVRARR